MRTMIALLVLLTAAPLNAQRWNELYEPREFKGMPVRVMKPIEFTANQKYPVIVSLHGAGGKGTNNRKQLKDWNRQLAETERRKKYPCYVVAPQADNLWDADDLNQLKALVKELPSVDMNRIYIMGHSMGGHGTYIFIQLDPDYFAAAAPSAGSGLKRTEDFIDPEKIKDIPIWAFHGDQDGVCPIEKAKKVFNGMKRLGGNMKLTIWKGDNHGVSGKMIVGADNGTTIYSSNRCDKEPDFMTWLFSQSKDSQRSDTEQSSQWKKHVVVPQALSMINGATAHDFDKDGHTDVITSFDRKVVLLRGPDWEPYTVHAFRPGQSRKKPRTACIHSCLMDADGDDDIDFIGSNNTVFWLECPTDPFSGQPWVYRTVDDDISGTHCLITGDVNQDGKRDLIANSGRSEKETDYPESIVWLETPANPHTAKKWTRHVFSDKDAPGGSHYMGFGDVNGDKRPDIACAAKGTDGFTGGQWFAWWEQPKDLNGSWTKHLLARNEVGATNILPADLDGDGNTDYFASRGHGNGVLWFRGPDFKQIEVDPKIEYPHSLALADINGDGNLDAVTSERRPTAGPYGMKTMARDDFVNTSSE